MKFPPTFSLTASVKQLIYDLDVLRAGYELHPVPVERAMYLRRVSILKSSLFSARIEGNPLELSDIVDDRLNDTDRHNIEVSNLVTSYEKMSELINKEVSVDTLKKLHAIVLHTLSADGGHLRHEESAIYNHAGIAVYLTPAPQKVFMLLHDLCAYVNSAKDSALVTAGVAHIWFEKIHPFVDGNGRVGRLLSSFILKRGSYDFGGLVPFEQYLDEHRDAYYHALGKDRQDVSDFVEFYLTALIAQAKVSLKSAHGAGQSDTFAHLLPRRAEIMRLIVDHKVVSFDFLARRFRAVPTRTLHYDLFQLMKEGLVQKMGSTRGALYAPSYYGVQPDRVKS